MIAPFVTKGILNHKLLLFIFYIQQSFNKNLNSCQHKNKVIKWFIHKYVKNLTNPFFGNR